jgi:hypothetical protein
MSAVITDGVTHGMTMRLRAMPCHQKSRLSSSAAANPRASCRAMTPTIHTIVLRAEIRNTSSRIAAA